MLSQTAYLRRISPLFFIPLSPSNLRPFGAPPSIGRRERPREPLPLEGAAERSEAGLAFFFAAKPPPLCLFPWERRCIEKSGILVSQPSPLGKGDRAAVDRVLSLMAHLRRSPSLSFIPLVPYPARFARHLPHAGKALSIGIVFPTYACIHFGNARKAVFSYRSLPHWGRGTAPAVDRVLSLTTHLRRISSLSFIPLVPYPARSARHLPHAGKALFRG